MSQAEPLGRPTNWPLVLPVLLGIAIMAWLFPAVAGAQTSFCPDGTGAGQCGQASPLAVNPANGDLYFLDSGNGRVSRFDSDGDFLLAFGWGVANGTTAALQSCGPAATPPTATCFKAVSGSGPDYASGSSIAVDASGAIYLASGASVKKFDSGGNHLLTWNSNSLPGPTWSGARLAIGGPTESVHVASNAQDGGKVRTKVDKFTAAGALLETVELTDPPDETFGIAVDSGGNIYSRMRGSSGLRKYSPGGGSPLVHFDPGVPAGGGSAASMLAMAAGDILYAAQADGRDGIQAYRVIGKYDVSGAVPVTVGRFGYGSLTLGNVQGLDAAVGPNGGAFLAGPSLLSDPTGVIVHLPEPPPGPLMVAGEPVVTVGGSVKVTVRAGINPEGKATSYRIQYVDQESFDEEGGFASPNARESAPISMVQEDFFMHSALATIGCPDPVTEAGEEGKCLTPETQYRFRVIAEHANGDQGNGPAEGQPFTTTGTIEFGEAWSTDVGAGSARLHGEVDPSGIPATGWFEYVEESVCKADEDALGPEHCFDRAKRVPDTAKGADPLDLGAGEDMKEASAFATNLAPGTTYRYRIVAGNPLIAPLSGPVRALRTFVAPRGDHEDSCANARFRTGVGSALPDCRAYELVSPVDKEGGDIVAMGESTNFSASYAQSATAGGKLTYSSVRSMGDAVSAPLASQYIATRVPDLDGKWDEGKEGWLSHGISPPRNLNILEEGLTLDAEFKYFSKDLCVAWLRHDSDRLTADAVPGYANLYKRDNCGKDAGAYEALTTATPPGGVAPKVLNFQLQGVSGNGLHAIYAAAAPLAGTAKPGILNVYDSRGGQQRLVCVLPGGAAVSSSCSAGSKGSLANGRVDAVAHAVSEDGSRVFWSVSALTSTQAQLYVRENGHGQGAECVNPVRPCTTAIGTGQYWDAAADGSAALYATPAGELRIFDVAAKASEPIAGDVEGVLGASEDLSRIYFLSREQLGGQGVDGAPNLYLREASDGGSEISFIATLAEKDLPSQEKMPSPVQAHPVRHTAHVTPGGGHLVFMSLASLTGADNRDASTGEPAAQVYRYEVSSGQLDCASCNPTGGRPVGRELAIPHTEVGTGIHASGQIATAQNQLYSERVITEDGSRIFFESWDALVLADTNGTQDVYQWEAAGKGDCAADSHSFNPKAGGCVALISSGRDSTAAEFVDASADGADVFFTTGASLVAQDTGLVDIYDARIGGGFPPPPPKAQECEGEACQSPPPPPADATPSSETFRGRGNVKAPALKKSKPRRCAKGKARKKGKCVAKKAKRGKKQAKKNKKRGKRAGANRRAAR